MIVMKTKTKIWNSKCSGWKRKIRAHAHTIDILYFVADLEAQLFSNVIYGLIVTARVLYNSLNFTVNRRKCTNIYTHTARIRIYTFIMRMNLTVNCVCVHVPSSVRDSTFCEQKNEIFRFQIKRFSSTCVSTFSFIDFRSMLDEHNGFRVDAHKEPID